MNVEVYCELRFFFYMFQKKTFMMELIVQKTKDCSSYNKEDSAIDRPILNKYFFDSLLNNYDV